MSKTLFLMHGVVPDYRLPLFDVLSGRLPEVRIAGGEDYFHSGIKNAALGRLWFVPMRNKYAFGRRILWQNGANCRGWAADGLIIELNPRIISGVILVALRAVCGRRTVMWGHVGKAFRSNSVAGWFRRALIGLGDGFLAYTHSDRVLLQSKGYRKPVWVTNNSCLRRDECIFSVASARNELIYVGRLVAPKKVDVLIDAFAKAISRLPGEVCLRIIGEGPERLALASQVENVGLTGRVEFSGHRSQIDYLQNAYANAFLAASPGYVGLSAIQALGHGVPVLIARDEPHSPEIEACREGDNALFFPSGNVAAAADLIVETWEHRNQWAAAGPSIAQDIAGRYTYEAMIEAIEAALRWQIEETMPR